MPTNTYNVITLCGSARFKKEFQDIWERLSLEGNIVLMPAPFWKPECRKVAPEVTELFSRMHMQKIDMSNEIFVVNPDGYIGEHTKKEIAHAMETGKKITYLVNKSAFIGTEEDNDKEKDDIQEINIQS